MKWTEFIQATAEKAGVSEAEARAVLEAGFGVIEDKLSEGGGVTLRGLGRFEATWREGRVLRSISSGRKMMLDGRYVPRFKAAAPLRRAMIARTPQRWQDARHQDAWRTAEALVGDLALYHSDRAPRGLVGDTDLETVHVACKLAFKNLWSQVESTYLEQVDEDVRAERDYLGEAAREQWGA